MGTMEHTDAKKGEGGGSPLGLGMVSITCRSFMFEMS